MSTLEFTAKVQDGKIEVPEAYQQLLQNIDRVKITVISNSRPPELGMIAHLIHNPIPLKTFVPLTREEAHERG